jgi:arginyl-tRNA synthetase
MSIIELIQNGVIEAVKALYGEEISADKITMNSTRKEFEGDFTVVVFPFTRMARKKPEEIGAEMGAYLVDKVAELSDFNVIKGFLNLVVADSYWKSFVEGIQDKADYGQHEANGKKVMVEFSSPNTNKPLHLGHIRNILLGWSISQIMETAGYEVIKTQIVNDRGIAICRSMLAWQLFGENQTPESTGVKGDHFVGSYYVKFAKAFEAEFKEWQSTDAATAVYAEKKKGEQSEEAFFKAYKNDYFNEYSKLGKAAKEMLRAWEAGDEEVRALWRKMNDWVLGGFDETYTKLGVSFDKLYFESDTYLLGKELIEEGIEKNVLNRDDKRVWVDLENIGLGHKTIIKSDGTSTYTSQDLGTAELRFQEFGAEKVVYVVGDEQISHFQGVFEILKRLGKSYAEGLYHLAYGMVDLPTGRMKSREGTVVDADDLMAEVIAEAKASSEERGATEELSAEEQQEIIRKIGLAALKFFIIKVNPRKRMTFDPKESVDMQGQTGPYVQNAYVRIQAVMRKAGDYSTAGMSDYAKLQTLEKDLIGQIYAFPALIQEAAENYDPSLIANYCYNLAKTFHKFYHDHPILKAESEEAKAFRLALSKTIGQVLQTGMRLLGIEMPDRM